MKRLFFFLFLYFFSLDAMHEEKNSIMSMQKDQYELRKGRWEDERFKNVCAGLAYLPILCFGCCFWHHCSRDYRQLRKDVLELRQKNIEVDDPACPPCCGWCAPLCFSENKVVPLKYAGK